MNIQKEQCRQHKKGADKKTFIYLHRNSMEECNQGNMYFFISKMLYFLHSCLFSIIRFFNKKKPSNILKIIIYTKIRPKNDSVSFVWVQGCILRRAWGPPPPP